MADDNAKQRITIEPLKNYDGVEIFGSKGESLAVSIQGPKNQSTLTREEMLNAKPIIWHPKINLTSARQISPIVPPTYRKEKFSDDAVTLQPSSEYPGATEFFDNNGNLICLAFKGPKYQEQLTREAMKNAKPIETLYSAQRKRLGKHIEPKNGSFSLKLVEDRTQLPYRAVGKIFIRYKDVDDLLCFTGFVVGENIIMTAAHSLLAINNPITLFLFVPAFNDGDAPYGTFEMKDYVIPNAFLIEKDEKKDIAFVHLWENRDHTSNRTVHETVGMLNVNFTRPLDNQLFRHIGYPMSIDKGECMYECEGKMSRFLENGSIVGKFSSPEMMYGSSGGPWLGSHSVVGGIEPFSIHEDFPNKSFSPTFHTWMSQFYEMCRKIFDTNIRLPLS